MDSRTEFEKALGVFRRMVATLDGAADLIDSVWTEDNGGSLDAILDLSARVKSALESVGIDVDEWLAEEAALEVIPGTEEAKRIEAEIEEAEEGCGAEGPEGYRCTEHRDGEHIARGPDPDSLAETWPLEQTELVDPTGQNRTGAARWHAAKAGGRELDEAEAAANRGDTGGGREDGDEVRARIWSDYQAEKTRLENESLRNERGLPGEEDER